jgi:hypothetical protein
MSKAKVAVTIDSELIDRVDRLVKADRFPKPKTTAKPKPKSTTGTAPKPASAETTEAETVAEPR